MTNKRLFQIHDEDARGNRLCSQRITVESDSLSIKELIQRRVQTEVERINIQRPICFFSLVKPEEAELTLKGYRMKKHRELDYDLQYQAALDAFEKKSFLVNANGKDCLSLDDEVSVNDGAEIVFIKFMEIVGG